MKHRILIADDDEAARSGLADLLSSWGYEVEQAIDGKDALEKAPEFGPAVVIADLVMPALDGVALLKPLAEVYPNAVVILLTLALRLIPSVDAHSLTSVLVFGPLTLLRPFVAAAGVALGAAAAPRPAVFTIGALVLGMMLSMERFLSRQAAREAASHRTSTMSNQGRSSWT